MKTIGGLSLYKMLLLISLVATVGWIMAGQIDGRSKQEACVINLGKIVSAKKKQAAKLNISSGNTNWIPAMTELFPKFTLQCPLDGKYSVGLVDQKPTCSIPGHCLP